MILIDTSAWVEFLRDTGSQVCERVDAQLGRRFATTDAVVMEVLAGARNDQHLHELRAMLGRASFVPCTSAHYLAAADVYRTCRASGVTVRSMLDCLIAAVAIDHDLELLHADRDFAAIAQCTALRVVS